MVMESMIAVPKPTKDEEPTWDLPPIAQPGAICVNAPILTSWSSTTLVLMIQQGPIVVPAFTTAPALISVPSPISTCLDTLAAG